MGKQFKFIAFILVFSVFVIGISLLSSQPVSWVQAAGPTPTPPPTGYVLNLTAKSLTSISITGKGATVSLNPPNQTYNFDPQPSVTYLNGTQVQITANNPVILPGLEYYVCTFVRWEGDINTSSNPISIAMDSNKNLTACYNVVFHSITPPPTPTPTATSVPGWVSYIPTVDQVVIKPDLTQKTVVVELTFPNAGYRVADPGSVAMSAGINPDGTTLMTFLTVGTKVERYTGVSAQVITTKTIAYNNLGFGTKNIFMFRVNDILVEQIEFAGPATVSPTPTLMPTPTPIAPTPTATSTPGWVSYIPTADQVVIKPDLTQKTVVVELTFPNAGYRVADPGSIAMSAGIYPDGSTLMTFITAGTKVERYTGVVAQVITTKTITYKNLGFGTHNIFRFCVYDAPVEQIEFAGPVTGTPSPTSTITATPTPTPINTVKLQFYNQSTAVTSNQIYTNIKLVNTSTAAITLSNVKIRYYYTVDGAKPQTFYCDYSPVGSSNVTGTFVTMSTAKTGADTYLEVGFTSGAASLAAGGNVTIQGRFAKNDWSNYTQTNDYSFNTSATTYVDWTKVTGCVSGALQWGVEP